MNTKNVKNIKIVGADTQRVMANNEVWWKKENPWIPVKGPVFKDDNVGLAYFEHQLNDYCPMKAIEFKIDRAGYIAKVGNYYSDGDFHIEFFSFSNKGGGYVSSKDSYDKKTGIFCMVFDEPVYKFEELYLKDIGFPPKYRKDEIEKIINLQFRIIE